VEGERPFAFSPTHEPRIFAKMLLDRTRKEPILYRTLAYHSTGEEFLGWIKETRDDYHVNSMVLVGGRYTRLPFFLIFNLPH